MEEYLIAAPNESLALQACKAADVLVCLGPGMVRYPVPKCRGVCSSESKESGCFIGHPPVGARLGVLIDCARTGKIAVGHCITELDHAF